LEIELSDGTTRAERVDRNSGRIVGKRVSVNVVGKAQRAKDMVVVVVESLLFEGRPAGQNKSRKCVECVFFMLKDLVTSNMANKADIYISSLLALHKYEAAKIQARL
jgi:hypothetical protein